MTNKIKSLIYLGSFIFAAIIYNTTIETNTSELSNNMELNKANTIADSNSEELHTSTMN
ncbi:hypothetical protein ACFQZJ_14435 [Maribacter chungangensis]|uniref:Uncharacterized protein n=1 Tax=Maribacter chungangensis TaxID=1069117 RepID=A0ABW3B5S1_9FLAO